MLKYYFKVIAKSEILGNERYEFCFCKSVNDGTSADEARRLVTEEIERDELLKHLNYFNVFYLSKREYDERTFYPTQRIQNVKARIQEALELKEIRVKKDAKDKFIDDILGFAYNFLWCVIWGYCFISGISNSTFGNILLVIVTMILAYFNVTKMISTAIGIVEYLRKKKAVA